MLLTRFKNRLDFTAYAPHTDSLSDYLTVKTAKHSKKLSSKIINAAKKGGPADVRAAVAEAKKMYKGVFDGMKHTVRKQLASTLLSGANNVGALGPMKRSKGRAQILDGLTKNVEFYSENYFRRIVEPKIRAFIVSNKNSPTFKADLEKLVKRSLLEGKRYWDSVSDTVSGRAYHYGLLKGAQLKGFSRFELMAVMDDRTTDFCKSINGKKFYISEGIKSIERMADLRGNDILHGPWTIASEGPATSVEMRSSGFMTPPFHCNCRTRLHCY